MSPSVVAVIQARMGSARLPGKTLLRLAGATVLEHVVNRARLARRVNQVVVATSTNAEDDAIAQECARLKTQVVRGSALDVLDRYAVAAEHSEADVVVRITGDCPLLDPVVVDSVVEMFLADPQCDYASNTLERTFPRGLDVEAVAASTIAAAAREADDPYEREHVTPFIYNRPERFTLRNVRAASDWSHLRWTLDTPVDYEYLESVFARVGIDSRSLPAFEHVARAVREDAGLMALNARAVQAGIVRPAG
jgi:spore coat polysaccharide biosynthesis protein SpsF